jgi:hypothetical protein
MNERPRNVIENKEPLRKTPGQGWYLYENTGGYPVIAGMLLKTKVVTYKPDRPIKKAPVGKLEPRTSKTEIRGTCSFC